MGVASQKAPAGPESKNYLLTYSWGRVDSRRTIARGGVGFGLVVLVGRAHVVLSYGGCASGDTGEKISLLSKVG